ncbi:MAG: hypothetical protein K0R50_481 [Eubacterium sp.]|jgi:hypothetical protein|nr:hypothetical protein [Eubacterium sp.]
MKKQNQKDTRQKRIDILIRLALILVIVTILFFFVVKPMLKKDYYFDAGEDYTFENLGAAAGENSYDVAVVGDGLDAVSSALGAAKVGARTVLLFPSSGIDQKIKSTLNINWSEDFTPTGNSVSSDFFKEIRYKSGKGSNLDNYINEMNELLSEYKNLTVIYDAKVLGVDFQQSKIEGIQVKTGQQERKIIAKRYIDSTPEGQLLQQCKVGFSTGYEDIGLKGLYPPVKLNFLITGVDIAKVQEMLEKQGTMVSLLARSYKPADNNIFLTGINISEQGNSSVVIEAVNVRNVDLTDEKSINDAYAKAKKECEDLYGFIKLNLEEFKNSTGMTVANEFIMSSPYHFDGRYHLTLSDVLTGKRFTDRISSASRPVTFTMDDGNRYVLCNPKTFYIPLNSIIPEGLDNVLMTGDKISASSLVQTAASSNSSIAGTGLATGIISAYSISKDMAVPMLVDDHNLDIQQEIEKILRKMGIYMSDIKEDMTSITGNWSYTYAEKLINLGLLSGGITNDYKYDKEAKSQDLAFIVLNGVPRVSEEAYNYNFDVSIRKYLKDEPLTKELFGRIVLELTGETGIKGDFYSEACKQGLIDETLQKKLENRKVLKYPEVYYASVKLIQKLTGKTIK